MDKTFDSFLTAGRFQAYARTTMRSQIGKVHGLSDRRDFRPESGEDVSLKHLRAVSSDIVPNYFGASISMGNSRRSAIRSG